MGFRLLKESLVYENFEKKFSRDYLLRERLKQKKESDVIFHVWDHWSAQNYFHWLLDTLTRISILTMSRPGKEIRIVLPDNLPAYAEESLKAFHDISVIFFTNHERVKARELYLITYPVSSGHTHPKYLFCLREFILNKAKEQIQTADRFQFPKVYISRGKASQRKVLNENELLEMLLPEGFTLIYMEDLSFWEQVSLAFYADIIISPHGAGLSNILFMRPGTSVIEINQENTENAVLCYWNLAKNIGLKYYYIPSSVSQENNYTLSEFNFAQIKNLITLPQFLP